MSKRRPMKKSYSKKIFRKTAKSHNMLPRSMRGGTRL